MIAAVKLSKMLDHARDLRWGNLYHFMSLTKVYISYATSPNI